MTSPRDALNDLKWHRHALDRATIRYTHRGAPGDERVVSGAEVIAIGASFFERTGGSHPPTMIPYHRIRAIELDGVPIWDRATSGGPG